jgi:hypothetical protein
MRPGSVGVQGKVAVEPLRELCSSLPYATSFQATPGQDCGLVQRIDGIGLSKLLRLE